MSEFIDFLGSARKGSTEDKIEKIMETIEVLSSIVGDKLPTIINQQIQNLEQKIQNLEYKVQNLQTAGPPGASTGAPPPPGMSSGAPAPPGMMGPGRPGGPPPMPGGGPPPPPGMGGPGAPPPPPGPSRGPAGPVSLKASIMDELKTLLKKRRTE
ncbi:MAG: hypothetical protein ACFFCS_09090 [Candidatus Hodarchaeota archaeon]